MTVLEEAASCMTVKLELTLPGGAVNEYQLDLLDGEEVPRVREREPRRFPAHCMERHINRDGTFCLSWALGEPSDVTDDNSARRFWSRLSRFLQYQESASVLRRWPGHRLARAHGNAAEYQATAEKLAAELGETVIQDLRTGALEVRVDNKKARSHRLELWRRGERVARVHVQRRALVSTHIRCLCDATHTTPVEIGTCGRHAQTVVHLVLSMRAWKVQHQRAVQASADAGDRCCGTIEHCELNRELRTRARRTHLGGKHGV